ncbi:hypothetical protein V6C03_13920 [Methyloligella sp. 2.7D]|uniref:hypothetical protein n=1 Tax=unclassified Methyloligella TaxID=2625955 RepID=UPI00157C12F1|nr:hypothetical protein [Methyloligella sp. GL2]QKP77143.1 hypothetical protein HT051_06545 [Methyloligella sp. GL2]
MAQKDGAAETLSGSAKTGIWIGAGIVASFLFSWALACITPFAALAAIAALTLSRRNAFLMVGVAFLINQAVGFLLLGYPHTLDTYGWGVAIGVAALAATYVASLAPEKSDSKVAVIVMGFLGAFVAYELVLMAATAVLPSEGGFSFAVIGKVFWINALAYAAFLALRWGGEAIGFFAGTGRGLIAAR